MGPGRMVLFSGSCRFKKFHKACPKPNLSVTNHGSKRNDTDSSRRKAGLQFKVKWQWYPQTEDNWLQTVRTSSTPWISEFLEWFWRYENLITRSKTAWETNLTGNKAADQTVMSCQCISRYTHPFMAEYLTLSCQCRSRYTHPFMAEYLTLSCQCRSRYTHPFMAEFLTLSCRISGEGCKKSSNTCHGTVQNATECTGRQKRSHICDKMIARCITQHKLVYRKILLNLRTLPPNRDPCYYVCHFKAISWLI